MVISLFGYHGLFLNQSEMFCLFGEVPLLEPSAMRFGLFSITSGEHNWPPNNFWCAVVLFGGERCVSKDIVPLHV